MVSLAKLPVFTDDSALDRGIMPRPPVAATQEEVGHLCRELLSQWDRWLQLQQQQHALFARFLEMEQTLVEAWLERADPEEALSAGNVS